MREYQKKFTSLKNLFPQTENNKKLKKELLINAGGLYDSLYSFKKINTITKKIV